MPVPGEHPIPHARRLHDRGVALLPVWAVEYSVLRQPARAFVSAMRAGPDPKVAGANPSPNPIPNPNPNSNPNPNPNPHPDPKVAGVTHYGAHALRCAVRVRVRAVNPNPNPNR